MSDPLYDALDASRLKGTSQGKKKDLPPKAFIRRELKQFGCLDTPPTYKADLKGGYPLKRDRWSEIEDDRYEALQQSFRLAARLLNSARPYLCNFLPRTEVTIAPPKEARIHLNDADRTMEEQNVATLELLQLLKQITWQECDYMWKSYSTLGITHTGFSEDIFEIFDYQGGEEDAEVWFTASKEADRLGLPYRSMTITLASQMVDAILASEPNTEQHMNAVFQAGITIVHELGHALFYCHKKEKASVVWVGDDQYNELGHSLIAWLFGGFYPQPIYIESDKFYREFRGGHAWHKMPRKPSREPLALIAHSMPMSHIQRILSAKSWEPFDFKNDPNVHLTVRNELLSPLPFKIGKHARYSTLFGIRNAWKHQPQYAGYRSAAKTFEDEDWDDAETASEAAAKGEAEKGLVPEDKLKKRKQSPDAQMRNRMKWLMERSYSRTEVADFLHANPEIRKRDSYPLYNKVEIARWHGKKMGIWLASDEDDVDDEQEERKRKKIVPLEANKGSDEERYREDKGKRKKIAPTDDIDDEEEERIRKRRASLGPISGSGEADGDWDVGYDNDVDEDDVEDGVEDDRPRPTVPGQSRIIGLGARAGITGDDDDEVEFEDDEVEFEDDAPQAAIPGLRSNRDLSGGTWATDDDDDDAELDDDDEPSVSDSDVEDEIYDDEDDHESVFDSVEATNVQGVQNTSKGKESTEISDSDDATFLSSSDDDED